jgi:hypothetical protein
MGGKKKYLVRGIFKEKAVWYLILGQSSDSRKS